MYLAYIQIVLRYYDLALKFFIKNYAYCVSNIKIIILIYISENVVFLFSISKNEYTYSFKSFARSLKSEVRFLFPVDLKNARTYKSYTISI